MSIGEELLALIDARAAALGLNRSQYFAFLARQDLAHRQPLALQEMASALNDAPSSTVRALAEQAADDALRVAQQSKPASASVNYSKPRARRRSAS